MGGSGRQPARISQTSEEARMLDQRPTVANTGRRGDISDEKNTAIGNCY